MLSNSMVIIILEEEIFHQFFSMNLYLIRLYFTSFTSILLYEDSQNPQSNYYFHPLCDSNYFLSFIFNFYRYAFQGEKLFSRNQLSTPENAFNYNQNNLCNFKKSNLNWMMQYWHYCLSKFVPVSFINLQLLHRFQRF